MAVAREIIVFEAGLICFLFSTKGLKSRISVDRRDDPVFHRTPSSVVYTLDVFALASDGQRKVNAVVPDLEAFINQARVANNYGNGLPTIVNFDGKSGTIEVSSVSPDVLPFVGSNVGIHSGLAGFSYERGKSSRRTWDLKDPNQAHMLLSGQTGGGKTNALLVLLLSLAENTPPDLLSLMVANLKPTLEMRHLKGLPHTAYVLESVREVEEMVARARADMEIGYRTGRKDGKRSIIVVDEYAVTVEASDQFRIDVADIARRGREIGLHLLLSTQKPAAKILDTQIRSNLAVRLCGPVPSAKDSFMALDTVGARAERLPGMGAFVMRVNQDPVRIYVPFVSDIQPEVERIAALYDGHRANAESRANVVASSAVDAWSTVEYDAFMLAPVVDEWSQANCIRLLARDHAANTGGNFRARFLKAQRLLSDGFEMEATSELVAERSRLIEEYS